MEGLAHWAWILSGTTGDEKCERFLAKHAPMPSFVLLEVLRHDIQYVNNLQELLVYLLSKRVHAGKDSQSQTYIGHVSMDWAQSDSQIFDTLLTRLLRQVRQIWPAAVVSVVSLVERRVEWMRNSLQNEGHNPLLLERITNLINLVLALLPIPGKVNPLISTRHVWDAQRRILEIASTFEPPVLLSQSTYRAVVSTLIASKKSDSESKSAFLRTRSWPPWRRDQDGMDARRSEEEDISRVLSALSKMQEAGYKLGASDEAARIYGGMEADGTPSIQTRRIFRRSRSSSQDCEMSSLAWAARIDATRDVQEAWGAFLECKKRGGGLTQALFFAMYQKINYHNSNLGGDKARHFSPGDGREVLPLSNESFTKYYIERHQPPPLDILYAEMLHNGIRPSGRCLAFLISKARTSDEGLAYLLDSDIEASVLERLRDPSLHAGTEDFKAIPDIVLCAYVQLICRLAPRSIRPVSTIPFTQEIKDQIREDRNHKGRHALKRETFKHVGYLLRSSSTKHRPTWYAYFRALAREGAIIPREVAGGKPGTWGSVTWSRMLGVLKGFHGVGLELDPQGFLHLCVGLEKFATDARIEDMPLRRLGPVHSTDRTNIYTSGAKVLKDEFAKLASSQSVSKDIPTLFHSIRGVHLHAYVRALGAVGDHIAILDTLKWMVHHNQDLEPFSYETRNGLLGFRNTLTAARHFIASTTYEQEAQDLVEQVEWWGAWPTSDEVETYLRKGEGDGTVFPDELNEQEQSSLAESPWLGS